MTRVSEHGLLAKWVALRAKFMLVMLIVVATGTACGSYFYLHNFNNHLDTVSSEADALLALSSSYVSVYSELRGNSHNQLAPVPAAFRAQATESIELKYDSDSHFDARMVGLPNLYIATPPTDPEMENVLLDMAVNKSDAVSSGLLKSNDIAIVRTMYPSIANQDSCVDCHNRIQDIDKIWKRGDVMGAYVIERGVQKTKDRYAIFGFLIGALVSLTLLSIFFVLKLNRDLVQRAGQLKSLANTDPLTGCLNRRALDNRINNLSRDKKANSALLLLDIDHFKRINDTHGHDVGDQVLIWFAKTVGSELRESDVLARVGGEEFSVYLPGTSEETARNVANRICKLVAMKKVEFGATNIGVTVSIGAIHTGRAPHQAMSIYNKIADKFLYRAKKSGRNRVVWAND